MDKNDIKQYFEKEFNDVLNFKIQVEFVDNVLKRGRDIIENDDVNWRKSYETDNYTGLFIPNTAKHCAYILIQDGRDIGLLIKSSFHEQKHAIDYLCFLSNIFNENQCEMINSNLYVSFQVFSEFEAQKYGWLQFLKFVDYDDMSKKEQIKKLLDSSKQCYDEIYDGCSKYQLLMHSIQYYGCLCAVQEYDDTFDLKLSASQMIHVDKLDKIFDMLHDRNEHNKDWFEKFDLECRKYWLDEETYEV